jgi:beta-aspartyl-peptidase (threonine type)
VGYAGRVRIFLGTLILVTLGCASRDRKGDETEIRGILDAQRDAWNRGDLEAFLGGYWRSGETVFAGGDQVFRGFEAMAERYRKTYPTRDSMGTLSFSHLAFEELAPDRAVVTGSWELSLANPDRQRGGVFTLLWRRLPEGWRIVHDHTSSRP